jgi:hypothetical protein
VYLIRIESDSSHCVGCIVNSNALKQVMCRKLSFKMVDLPSDVRPKLTLMCPSLVMPSWLG